MPSAAANGLLSRTARRQLGLVITASPCPRFACHPGLALFRLLWFASPRFGSLRFNSLPRTSPPFASLHLAPTRGSPFNGGRSLAAHCFALPCHASTCLSSWLCVASSPILRHWQVRLKKATASAVKRAIQIRVGGGPCLKNRTQNGNAIVSYLVPRYVLVCIFGRIYFPGAF